MKTALESNQNSKRYKNSVNVLFFENPEVYDFTTDRRIVIGFEIHRKRIKSY